VLIQKDGGYIPLIIKLHPPQYFENSGNGEIGKKVDHFAPISRKKKDACKKFIT